MLTIREDTLVFKMSYQHLPDDPLKSFDEMTAKSNWPELSRISSGSSLVQWTDLNKEEFIRNDTLVQRCSPEGCQGVA